MTGQPEVSADKLADRGQLDFDDLAMLVMTGGRERTEAEYGRTAP
jgi:hypothetical protein